MNVKDIGGSGQLPPEKGSYAAAVGCFDGVHIGHRALLDETVKRAGAMGLVPAAVTFRQIPKNAAPLTAPDTRAALMAECGIKTVFMLDFSAFRGLSPRDFIGFLADLGVRYAVCGYNFRFGAGASAGAVEFLEISELYGIGVSVMPAVSVDGIPVSSSWIRRLLSEGDAKTAAVLLGRLYTVSGTISRGKQFGRTVGMPTINLYFPSESIAIACGVYFSRCRVRDVCYDALTNVKEEKPGTVLVESHLFGFSGDAYGAGAQVSFLCRHRAERHFRSAEELSQTLMSDRDAAVQYFASSGR